MRQPLFATACGVGLMLASVGIIAQGVHSGHGAPDDRVGRVEFTTSCSSAAQSIFNRAVALLHSFEFGRAIDGFNAVLAADKSCAMAEWGIALSRWGNPF